MNKRKKAINSKILFHRTMVNKKENARAYKSGHVDLGKDTGLNCNENKQYLKKRKEKTRALTI